MPLRLEVHPRRDSLLPAFPGGSKSEAPVFLLVIPAKAGIQFLALIPSFEHSFRSPFGQASYFSCSCKKR